MELMQQLKQDTQPCHCVKVSQTKRPPKKCSKFQCVFPPEGLNLTLIIKTMKMKGIIDIEGNKLAGTYGSMMDSLLENVDHSERDCKLVGTDEFGHQLPNGSYTGVLKLLQEKKGDLYLSPSPQFFYTDFIDQTTAILTDK